MLRLSFRCKWKLSTKWCSFAGWRWYTVQTRRRAAYATVVDSDVQIFERILGSNNVLLPNSNDLDVYNTDWMGWYKGSSACVLLPNCASQVSAILQHCFNRKLALVPQSGNTGLVGGSVPLFDEIVLNMKNMNQQFHLNFVSGILRCDSGWILDTLNNRLAEFDYMMPLDLSAKGSCMIGGNFATGAGGMRLLRYGSLHAHLLGLQVVLADKAGTILDCGSTLRKDNTSFHDAHLFVGSEGQLGVITSISMTVVPRPSSVQVAMLGCSDFSSCCLILTKARKMLGEILSSFEFMDAETIRCVQENHRHKSVLSSSIAFHLLIETSGSSLEQDRSRLTDFLEFCLNKNLAVDCVEATSGKQAANMWALREHATLALKDDGYVYKHDVSLPLEHYYRLTQVIRRRVQGMAKRVATYGHLGDGNSHLNVTSEHFSEDLHNRLYPFIYEWTTAHGGSISAEHGIGQLKKQFLRLGKMAVQLEQMKHLKRCYDPAFILNPYKMISSDDS